MMDNPWLSFTWNLNIRGWGLIECGYLNLGLTYSVDISVEFFYIKEYKSYSVNWDLFITSCIIEVYGKLNETKRVRSFVYDLWVVIVRITIFLNSLEY